MMMMIKKWCPIIILLVLSFSAFAQKDDFGIWYGAGVKHELLPKLKLNVSAEVRTFENAGKVELGFLETGLEYKLTGFISVEGSYRLINALEDDSKYHLQHKAFVDLKGNLKVADFTFSVRFRFQTRFKTYFVYVEDKVPDYNARIKLKAAFRTPSFPVDPYIYAESFFPLFTESDRVVGKTRLGAGLEYQISKNHSVEAEYIFQRDYLPTITDVDIVSLAYKYLIAVGKK